MSITVSVPATTANLGPGYDCIALALQPRCRVVAEPADRWQISHVGREGLPEGAEDTILQAARKVASGPLSLTVDNEIPIGKGLGSSAAALTAGLAIGLASTGELGLGEVFRMAAEMEGHPEQVGAAIYGGLVLIGPDGSPAQLPVHPRVRVVVGVPDQALATGEARLAVPTELPLEVVVRSLSRVAALVGGLVSGDPLLLSTAGGDEIHEAARAAISPVVVDLIRTALAAGAWHAARSGAGPSVVAICGEDEEASIVAAFEAEGVRVVSGDIDTRGLIVS